jgi:hypothetical protein
MKIKLACEGCGQKLTAKESLGGKTVKCPKCKAPVQVPAAAPDLSDLFDEIPLAPEPSSTATAPPDSAGRKCIVCGHTLEPDVSFCIACGTSYSDQRNAAVSLHAHYQQKQRENAASLRRGPWGLMTTVGPGGLWEFLINLSSQPPGSQPTGSPKASNLSNRFLFWLIAAWLGLTIALLVGSIVATVFESDTAITVFVSGLAICISAPITAGFLCAALLITGDAITVKVFLQCVGIAALVSLVGLVPVFGCISPIVFWIFVSSTFEKNWLQTIMIVLITGAFGLGLEFLLVLLFAGFSAAIDLGSTL